jgi:hypothetical protein
MSNTRERQIKGTYTGVGSCFYQMVHNAHIFYMLMILCFFLKAEVKNVDAVLWALFSFEVFSGIKISYNKTELILINLG